MLATVVGSRWHYRRDRRISLPTTSIGSRSTTGLPILKPEIQLLYKSVNPRPKDSHDLETVLPYLPADQKAWLVSALKMVSPDHGWIDIIKSI